MTNDLASISENMTNQKRKQKRIYGKRFEVREEHVVSKERKCHRKSLIRAQNMHLHSTHTADYVISRALVW